jgi:hypothetical protein
MKGGCGVILLALLLLMWPGLQTLKGRLLGLWLGTLISAGGLVFSSLVWVYSIYSERDYGRPPTDQPLFSLIGLIALYSLVLHIAALVSRRAGES